ncbi:MAG: hypothetical protein ABJB66_20185, partial [Gemmatimonadaceae bacterium]
RRLTSLSDVFALGIVMFESLTGYHPYQRNQHNVGTVRPNALIAAPNAPRALTNLIDGMLNIRTAFRPSPANVGQTCSDIITQLQP